jgi:hypothetical protein
MARYRIFGGGAGRRGPGAGPVRTSKSSRAIRVLLRLEAAFTDGGISEVERRVSYRNAKAAGARRLR